MSGSYPKRGPVGPVEQAYEELVKHPAYVASHRAPDITDGNQAIDLYVGNPSDHDTDLLTSVGFGAGGASHLDTGENASIDTSGTPLQRQAKGADGTGQAVIEQGGDYTSENPLETIVVGTLRGGGPPTAARGSDELPDVRLLEPGEAVQYTVTNESGNTVDFDATANVAEVDR